MNLKLDLKEYPNTFIKKDNNCVQSPAAGGSPVQLMTYPTEDSIKPEVPSLTLPDCVQSRFANKSNRIYAPLLCKESSSGGVESSLSKRSNNQPVVVTSVPTALHSVQTD